MNAKKSSKTKGSRYLFGRKSQVPILSALNLALRVLKVPGTFSFFAGVALVVWGASAQGAVIEGTIRNATAERPAIAEEVVLMRLEGGMQRVASIRSANGSFRFELPETPQVPHLVQVHFQGVRYNTPVRIDGSEAARVEAVVYETTESLEGVRVEKPHLFVRAEDDKLRIEWALYLVNDPAAKRTVVHPQGTFRFTIPEDAADILYVTAQSGSMPVPQSPTKVGPGLYALPTALKPGETEVRLGYEVPYTDKRYKLSTFISYPIEELWLFVSPADIQVGARGLAAVDRDEVQGFAYFQLHNLAAESLLALEFQGGTQRAMPDVTEYPRWSLRLTWSVILAVWAFFVFSVWVTERVALVPRRREAAGG